MTSRVSSGLFGVLGQFRSKKRRSKELRRLVEQSELFDRQWYLLDNPDVLKSGSDPLTHFVEFGDLERRSPGPAFNSRAYVEAWSDVATSKMGALEHFLRIGRLS